VRGALRDVEAMARTWVRVVYAQLLESMGEGGADMPDQQRDARVLEALTAVIGLDKDLHVHLSPAGQRSPGDCGPAVAAALVSLVLRQPLKLDSNHELAVAGEMTALGGLSAILNPDLRWCVDVARLGAIVVHPATAERMRRDMTDADCRTLRVIDARSLQAAVPRIFATPQSTRPASSEAAISSGMQAES
jgi:hypothetical protein